MWRRGPEKAPEEECREDRGTYFPCISKINFFVTYPTNVASSTDLDFIVSSKGLDQILTPPAGQAPNEPRTRSFFQSVTVTKVVKPDGVSDTVYLNIIIIIHILIYTATFHSCLKFYPSGLNMAVILPGSKINLTH